MSVSELRKPLIRQPAQISGRNMSILLGVEKNKKTPPMETSCDFMLRKMWGKNLRSENC